MVTTKGQKLSENVIWINVYWEFWMTGNEEKS
jgi:hypothetical protein